MYAPTLWPEPFAIRAQVSRLLLPFSVLSGAVRQQAQRRRMVSTPVNATVYVSGAGSDGNGGLSIGAPVLTFARAATIAGANAAITTIAVLNAGTWHEAFTFPRNGLTFTAGSSVTIDGDATRPGINLNGKANCAVAGGLRITNTESATYGIVGSGTNGAVIDGPRIDACPRGIYIASASGLQIRNILTHDISDRHGIELRSCTAPLVEDVEGYRCASRVLYLDINTTGAVVRRFYGHDAIDTTDYIFEAENGCDDLTVLDSWAGAVSGTPPKYGFISKLSARSRFQRVVTFGISNASAGAGVYFKGAVDGKVYHSDVYGGAAAISGVYVGYDDVSGAVSSGIEIKNSIIANNGYGVRIESGSSIAASDYNDFSGNTVLGRMLNTNYSQAAWQAAGNDTHSLFVNPSYASTVYGGFAPGNAAVLSGGGDLGEGAGLPQGHTGSTWNG